MNRFHISEGCGIPYVLALAGLAVTACWAAESKPPTATVDPKPVVSNAADKAAVDFKAFMESGAVKDFPQRDWAKAFVFKSRDFDIMDTVT